MSWRSVKNDPPEMVRILTEYGFSKSDGLLLTDGKNVYAGTILHYNGGYMFEGYDLGEVADIDNFTIIRFECGESCQWMPMVSAQPKQKSAGEMFQELGYTVKKHDNILESTTYSKPKNRSKTVDEISCDRNGVFTAYHKFGGFETFCMNSREVLVCARLIEEMGESE